MPLLPDIRGIVRRRGYCQSEIFLGVEQKLKLPRPA
jgi:hypothetical protein